MSGDVNFTGTQEEWDELVKSHKAAWIAKACHEANRAWCQANGDDTQKHWEDAEQW